MATRNKHDTSIEGGYLTDPIAYGGADGDIPVLDGDGRAESSGKQFYDGVIDDTSTSDQIPNAENVYNAIISTVESFVRIKGIYNAATNTPELEFGIGEELVGYYVGTPGTQTLPFGTLTQLYENDVVFYPDGGGAWQIRRADVIRTVNSISPTSGNVDTPISSIPGLGANVATFLGTPSSANLRAALTDETGTGAAVFANSPSLVTPDLGTPSALNLSNATALPLASVTGLGTGIATALGVNVGTDGAPVIRGGSLGTPSGGNLANCTGYLGSNVSGAVANANLAANVAGGAGVNTLTPDPLSILHIRCPGTGLGVLIDGFGFGIGWGYTMRPATATDMQYTRFDDSAGNQIGSFGTFDNQTGVNFIGAKFAFSNEAISPLFTTNAAPGTGTSLIIDASNRIRPLTSSQSFKENIKPLTIDFTKINEFQPIEYDYKDGGGHDFGYLAESIYAVMPNLVNLKKNAQGYLVPYSIKYDRLGIVAIEYLKYIQQQLTLMETTASKQYAFCAGFSGTPTNGLLTIGSSPTKDSNGLTINSSNISGLTAGSLYKVSCNMDIALSFAAAGTFTITGTNCTVVTRGLSGVAALTSSLKLVAIVKNVAANASISITVSGLAGVVSIGNNSSLIVEVL